MSNERVGVDRVLDWIVPIRLSGKWMSIEVERGVKIMLSLILLATVSYHAINKTLEVLPPDATDSVVWTKFSLYLLCDIIVYIGIIALLSENGKLMAAGLAAEIGVTAKAVEKHLAKLKAEGLIEREGPDKGGSWKVK